MIADIKPYPRMKDSGVPWLVGVPEHWGVKRAKTLLRTVDVRSESGAEELLTVSSNLGVIPRRSANVTMFKAESYTGHKLCWPGDLVINSLWAWARGLGVSQHHGIVSTAYGVYRVRDTNVLDPDFVHELARSVPFHWELRVRSKGVWTSRLQLTDVSFLEAPFPLPPLPEQAAIVRFLDYMDRRIRRYIRAKQTLIKLLEEQKQAIIHHAVTRGLDADVRLKPSGVEWLGDVPAHWEVRFLGRCLRRIDQGWSPVAAEGDISPDQWAVLTLSSVKQGAFNSRAIKPVQLSAKIPEGIEIEDGDLLLTRSNTRKLVGDVCIVKNARSKTLICDLIYRLTPESTILCSSFLMLMLLSQFGRRQIERDARGSSGTMPKIAQRHIRSWRVVVPPHEEQRSIVRDIEVTSKDIDAAIDRANREISLLREYRTRLIAAVVTGKLDVREAAARLPNETELVEPASEDELLDNGSEADAEIEADAADAEA